jgi:hypothetical protein
VEFPEAGAFMEMLGDLLEPPRGERAATPEAGTAWADVPAGEEWASLMGPASGAGGGSPPVARGSGTAPAARDVLLDALAAGERVGLLSAPDARDR